MTKPLPSWQSIEQHDLLAKASHDEVSRLNFLTHLNVHLSAQILPGVKTAYEQDVLPKIIEETGEQPKDRHQVRQAMLDNGYFQMWSALRRNTMEMRQQLGRSQVLRQVDEIVEKVETYNRDAETLMLDESIQIPEYVSSVDIHCQPGCYYTEYFENDVTVAASYDLGLFVTTAGLLGALNDGGGKGVGNFLSAEYPDFNPKRILDIGCTIGHNAVPLAQAFPDAEVIAIDVARPCLRYGHARAKALGVDNITFMQANGEDLSQFADESFDLITTSMFWHETSHKAMPAIMKTIHRLLSPGGLTLHLEQPQYQGMSIYEQFIRDWDTYFNNEPYWGPMHDADLNQVVVNAGFSADDLFQTGVVSLVDEKIFGRREAGDSGEDYGRAPVWNAFGMWKKAS
ncbi:class I SAM-dependent methyltransferase [Thalassotalea mangrovi]|nr:class I SAM-dependent methyltransferase [Thalassotalea mangrovi]